MQDCNTIIHSLEILNKTDSKKKSRFWNYLASDVVNCESEHFQSKMLFT